MKQSVSTLAGHRELKLTQAVTVITVLFAFALLFTMHFTWFLEVIAIFL